MIRQMRTKIFLRAAALMAFALVVSACDGASADSPASTASPSAAGASANIDAASSTSDQSATITAEQDSQRRPCWSRRWGSAQVSLCSSHYSVSQAAGSVTLTVTRSGNDDSAISVGYATANGTAIAGSDYTAETGTLKWAENDATSKTVSIPIKNSSAFSGDKTFQLVLSKPSAGAAVGNPGSATVTIAGDASASVGTLELTEAAYTVGQAAKSVTVTVNRTAGAVGATSVAYSTANGTAVAGKDFTTSSGTLDWAAGDSAAKSFSIPISNATPFTGNKTFDVTLSKATAGAMLGTPISATITIAGDKSAPVGSLQLAAPSYTAAQSAGAVTVKVARMGGSNGAVSVAYATANGTAVAGAQYTATSGSLKWADGDATAKSFAVPVSNATPFTGNKSFTVALSTPSAGATISSPGSASVAITGDAAAPVGTLDLSASSYAVSQGAGSLTVTVNRTGGSAGAISVGYSTANGTAVAGTDYTAADGTLKWAAGDAAAKTFSIPVSNSAPFSGTKSLTVALANPSTGATVSSPSSAIVTISGDAVAAVGNLQLSASSYGIAQAAGSLTVTVNRTGGSSGAVSAAYAIVAGTAAAGTNYTATSGTLKWASGDAASKTIVIPISNATPFTGGKTFTIELSSPAGGAKLGSPSSAAVTIAGSAAAAPTAGTVWVYYNGVFNWGGDWSFSASQNYKDTSGAPLEGPYDIEVTSQQWGGWQPYHNANCQSNVSLCFPTTPYKYIIFSAKPTVAGQKFGVGFMSSGDTPDGPVLSDSSPYCSGGSSPAIGQWESCKSRCRCSS